MSIPSMRLPWWSKPIIKKTLTCVPISYRTWANIGLFRWGKMDDSHYAVIVFNRHFDRVKSTLPTKNFVGLELGPGDSVASAVIAASYGASKYYLVDIEDFATADMASYRKLGVYLQEQGLTPPPIAEQTTREEVLSSCNAQYLTQGLASLRGIPSASVHYIWSHSTLQHIFRCEFDDYLSELRRILTPDGLCSHYIDLQDMLANGLNNLRFSNDFWESRIVAASGYYTNRIRFGEMIEHFRRHGFVPTVYHTRRWEELPVKRGAMAEPFSGLPEQELLVKDFAVLLNPA